MADSNTSTTVLAISATEADNTRKLTQGLTFHSEKVPLSKMFANYHRNVRIRQGAEVMPGVIFNADTYNTDKLEIEIIEVGFIRETMTVSAKMVNGERRFEVMRGFRRFDAATNITRAGVHLNVIRSFEEIPCQVYENLTKEQEDTLFNDQTAKPFAGCEVLLDVFRRMGNGESWQSIGLTMAEPIARVTGSRGKEQEIKKAGTRTEKLKIVSSWLNNTLNQFWQSVFINGGPTVRKWLFLSIADKDGLIPEGGERCPFPFTSRAWTEKDKGLAAAIKRDREAGVGDAPRGVYGPEFKAAVTRLTAEELARKAGEGSGKAVKVKPVATVQAMLVADGRSLPITQTLESVLEGEGVVSHDLQAWDVRINGWLAKRESFTRMRGHLPPAVAEMFALALDDSASAADFDAKLASFVVPAVPTPEPAPELPTLPPESPLEGAGELFNLSDDSAVPETVPPSDSHATTGRRKKGGK